MVTILSGSSRKNSNTLKVAKAIALQLSNSECNIINFENYDIPFYNGSAIDWDNLTLFQQQVKDSMAKSKIIFVLTPEYNWLPSAEIINLINQYGGAHNTSLWNKKLFAICGVSVGRGGRLPAIQLSNMISKLINVFSFESVVSSKIFESQMTSHVLDESGNSLNNIEYDKGLEAFVNYNVALSNALNF